VKVLAAPDKFRGSASAVAVARAIAAGAESSGATTRQLPLADGGEGTLEVLGGANRIATVTGPLGDPVDAPWRLHRGEAVIEMAAASGLDLVGGPTGNDPLAASTAGTGELISAAVDLGARRIIVGLGGSATTDGGLAALRSLYPLPRLKGVELVVACDVDTSFLDAAETFAPQKGASPAQVALLTRRLQRLAEVYREDHGIDVTARPGAGAAGGLAGGLMVAGGHLRPGFDLVADEVDLDGALADVDLVITGEGRLDEQTFHGKVVGGVVDWAAERDVPVVAIVGTADDTVAAPLPVISLVDRFGAERSFAEPLACLTEVAAAEVAERM
jgi:glycerate kinase